MSDDWEAEDWESDSFKPQLASAAAAKPSTAAVAGELDALKFADEDGEEEEQDEAEKHGVPKSQPKTKEVKTYGEKAAPAEKPLDDPIAEKARQQRLVEQSDFDAARDLFSGVGGEANKSLDDILPKTLKDFEDFADKMVTRYILPHRDAKPYKAFLKALLKGALAPMLAEDTKDIETSVAGMRADKVKSEKAASAIKKGAKKNLNLGTRGGGAAGLDDYQFESAAQDDGDDFM